MDWLSIERRISRHIDVVLSLNKNNGVALSLLFLLCAIPLGGWWLSNHQLRPPVGVYIAIMGTLAAVMALRKEPSRFEKSCWIMAITVLMSLEIHNIYRTDNEQAQVFSSISKDLSLTKQGLDVTARKIGEATAGIGKLYSEATGGDSYIYFDITDISGPLGMDAGGLKKGMMVANTVRTFVGTFPLHNVYLSEVSPLGDESEIDYGTVSPKEFGKPHRTPYVYFYPGKPKQFLVFFINTSNGSYTQVVLVEQFNDKWLWASRLSKYGRKQPIRTWCAKEFPKERLNSEWDKK